MELPLVPKTQTIVVSQERCKVFEDTDGEDTFFTSTPLDDKVNEFCMSVQDAGGAVVSTTFAAGNENIIAVISWFDKNQITEIERKTNSKLATPQSLKLV